MELADQIALQAPVVVTIAAPLVEKVRDCDLNVPISSILDRTPIFPAVGATSDKVRVGQCPEHGIGLKVPIVIAKFPGTAFLGPHLGLCYNIGCSYIRLWRMPPLSPKSSIRYREFPCRLLPIFF